MIELTRQMSSPSDQKTASDIWDAAVKYTEWMAPCVLSRETKCPPGKQKTLATITPSDTNCKVKELIEWVNSGECFIDHHSKEQPGI